MPLPRHLQRKKRQTIHLPISAPGHDPMLGHYNYTRAQSGLPEHAHRGVLEICFLARGRQTYSVAGRDYRLRGGDIFLTFPNEVHGTGGAPEEKGELYWLMLPIPPRREGLLRLPTAQSRALSRDLLALKPRHFRGTWKMKDLLDGVLVRCGERPGAMRDYQIANRIGAFLLEVIASAKSAAPRPSAPGLEPVLAYITRHLDEPLSVPVLAQQAGISVARFKARFKEETGIPPGEYVLRRKVETAQKRLRNTDESVTRIAFDLGFSSSQYFATVYKRYTGHTPSRERAA